MTTPTEVQTCSIWHVPPGREEAFLAALTQFTRGADVLGQAREGVVLQDIEDSSRFVVLRRWENEDAVARWQDSQQSAASSSGFQEFSQYGTGAFVMRKVADLPA